MSPDPTGRARSQLIFGTDQPTESMRTLKAGSLSLELADGKLRYIRWGGFELIRAIAFVLRDTSWGTHIPHIADLDVNEGENEFRVTYIATLASQDGDFSYTATVVGMSIGQLDFEVRGRSDSGFTTCRTGSVVLHPLQGVVGHAFDVRHPAGATEPSRFPKLIDPAPPATEIGGLAHEPCPHLRLDVRFEGDSFEMEDHRNWTDASFKTYVRPLSRGYPYSFAAGENVAQAIRIRIDGSPPASVVRSRSPRLTLGNISGRVPDVGVFLERANDPGPASARELRPTFALGRVDLTQSDPVGQFQNCAIAAAHLVCDLELEIVIPGLDPAVELAPLADIIASSTTKPAGISIFPYRDLKSRPANVVPAGEASPAEILTAARACFGGTRLGGGMPCGFPELNRNRPAVGIDFITHATQAIYHAADDISVMETLEAVPHIVMATRAIVGAIPYRIAPATIGLPRAWSAGTAADNPHDTRVAMAESDPRQRGLFAAAFAMGYAAAAARAGVEVLALASPSGAFAAFDQDGVWRPLAAVVAGLATLSGRPRVEVSLPIPTLAGLAATVDDGLVLWLANLSAKPIEVSVGVNFGFASKMVIDAEALAESPANMISDKPFSRGVLALDSYAVCRLR